MIFFKKLKSFLFSQLSTSRLFSACYWQSIGVFRQCLCESMVPRFNARRGANEQTEKI